MADYDKNHTVGVLVTKFRNQITNSVLDRVEASEYNAIITDRVNIYIDLFRFVANRRSIINLQVLHSMV